MVVGYRKLAPSSGTPGHSNPGSALKYLVQPQCGYWATTLKVVDPVVPAELLQVKVNS
jgi:hypothetical protein